ncbi:hypothetical protein [Microlunatus endophyticus]|uniref:hypothetical protein n=1 Tax=Microlunatus endophyticus TaxID=1716077 RepID=UPI0016644218|nr:hypothetical protein [Microlunatus endophyticus]
MFVTLPVFSMCPSAAAAADAVVVVAELSARVGRPAGLLPAGDFLAGFGVFAVALLDAAAFAVVLFDGEALVDLEAGATLLTVRFVAGFVVVVLDAAAFVVEAFAFFAGVFFAAVAFAVVLLAGAFFEVVVLAAVPRSVVFATVFFDGGFFIGAFSAVLGLLVFGLLVFGLLAIGFLAATLLAAALVTGELLLTVALFVAGFCAAEADAARRPVPGSVLVVDDGCLVLRFAAVVLAVMSSPLDAPKRGCEEVRRTVGRNRDFFNEKPHVLATSGPSGGVHPALSGLLTPIHPEKTEWAPDVGDPFLQWNSEPVELATGRPQDCSPSSASKRGVSLGVSCWPPSWTPRFG